MTFVNRCASAVLGMVATATLMLVFTETTASWSLVGNMLLYLVPALLVAVVRYINKWQWRVSMCCAARSCFIWA
jgi:hypothetical protein